MTTRDRPNVSFCRQWLAPAPADRLLHTCRRELPWRQEQIRMFGRWVWQPRLQVWMGDPAASYRYSGQTFPPEPWLPALRHLADELEASLGASFNSVLCNAYEQGQHSMGWHSDNERKLGTRPLIASLSLGAGRRFILRRKNAKAVRHEWTLGHGDLLVMQGDTQTHWEHSLPKTARPVGTRLNLTFRYIHPGAG